MNIPALLLYACLLISPVLSADTKTVSAEEANGHIATRVDPVVPALAKTLKVGGQVLLTIDISPNGDVENVRVKSGHPMLVQSAIDAVRKWKYKPFSDNGASEKVSTEVEIDFKGGMSKEESDARNKFFPQDDKCRALVTKRDLPEAEVQCRKAVELSNALPPEAKLERSGARAMMGHAVYLQGRYRDAVSWYADALKIDQDAREPDDADLGSSYANLARAQGKAGEWAKADELYAKCVSSFESAIKSLPDMKDNYTKRLKRFLNEYAVLKDAEGQSDAAKGLRKKADAL